MLVKTKLTGEKNIILHMGLQDLLFSNTKVIQKQRLIPCHVRFHALENLKHAIVGTYRYSLTAMVPSYFQSARVKFLAFTSVYPQLLIIQQIPTPPLGFSGHLHEEYAYTHKHT